MSSIVLRNAIYRKSFKFFVVALGLLAGPGVLFTLPYILGPIEYANFAKMLAVSQLISIVGTVGLEVACPRLGVKVPIATRHAVITTLLAAFFLYFLSRSLSTPQYILAVIAALCNTLNAIYQSYLVFSGRTMSYGISGAAKAITILLVLILFLHAGFDAGVAWSVASVIALMIATYFMVYERDRMKVDDNPANTNLAAIFKLGLPLAVIYGTATLPFVLDRVVAQSHLSSIEFARYAVAVTWAVPLVYVGNVFQQFIIAESDEELFSKFAKFATILFVLEVCYAMLIVMLILIGVKIPYFTSPTDFFSYWGPIVSVYGIYSAFAFPAAALIQKSFAVKEIAKLAALTAIVVGFSSVLLYVFSKFADGAGIAAPIVCSLIFGLASILPRLYSVCKHISTKKIA